MFNQLQPKVRQQYIDLSNKLLPVYCPKCLASNAYLVLDIDDKDYAYCTSHYGTVFIGPIRDASKSIDYKGSTKRKYQFKNKNKTLVIV